jgi:hypothetical protein
VKGFVTFEATGELEEYGGCEGHFGGGVEIKNCFEGAGVPPLCCCLFAEHEFVDGGHNILETGDMYNLLRDTVMGGLLIIIHTLSEVETRLHGLANEVHNIPGYGGGEHHSLTGDFFGVGEMFLDLVDFFGEAVIQQPIGLVHNQSIETGSFNARVRIREDIEETTGRAHENMAALSKSLLKHDTLLGSANCALDDKPGSRHNFPCLYSNLLRKFSGR